MPDNSHNPEPDTVEQAEPEAAIAGESSTREVIVNAALRILGRDGYRAVTARAIAAEAGTNLALVNYYFGSKRNLLLSLFDTLEDEKYRRQWQMYETPGEPLSQKWRRAVEFYRQDLADGFVRINHELLALGYSDPVFAERSRQRIERWRELLREVAEAYLPPLGIHLPPDIVVSALYSFWYGMESQHLIDVPENEGHLFEILDLVGDWLEEQERNAAADGDGRAEHDSG